MFTISLSTLPIVFPFHVLPENSVALLADVRRIPRPQYNPQFGTKELSAPLCSVRSFAPMHAALLQIAG
jgi:hypothetical protein